MALAIDTATPAVAVQTSNTTTTVTTASFTPPAGSVLYIRWSWNTNTTNLPGAPTITDSLGSHLTYTLIDHQSRNNAPTVDGQCAHWWAVVSTSAAMTITVTSGTGTTLQAGALHVTVLTGADTVTPIGAHGKSGSTSAASIAQAYTAQATGGQGFIGVVDWDLKGAESAGTGCTLTNGGSGNAGAEISYGFLRRASADDSNGVANTLNVTIPTTSTNLQWVYAEIKPAVGAAAAATPAPLVVTTQWAPTATEPFLSASFPLGNPAVPTPAPLVVSPRFAPAPIPEVLLFGPGAQAATVTPTSTPGPLVVGPDFAPPPVFPALVFSPTAVATTGNATVVSPPYVPVPIPAVTVTASQPLGNPAVGTPGALVVSTPWSAKVPGAIVTFNPAAPVISTTATPGPLVVSPPYAPVLIPDVTISASQPLGNPAVGTPGPLVISAPWSANVPGALLSSNPAAPVVSTIATPNALVVGPPNIPVPIPQVVISASQPLGNPATSTPQPLVVSTFTLAQVPGAKVFGAPQAPPVPAVPTPGPVIVTPPWQPVPIPTTFFSSSFPLGTPAVATPQPLVVTPPQRWPVWTASLVSASPVLVTVTPSRTPTLTVDLSRLTVTAETGRLQVAYDAGRASAAADLSRAAPVVDLTRSVVVVAL